MVLPVPIPAVTHVIVVVPTNVPADPKTIPVLKPEQPNADQYVVIAAHLAPVEARLIPVLLFLTMNVAALVVLVLLLVLPEHHRQIQEVVEAQQETNAELKPVIILMSLAILTLTLVLPDIHRLVLTDIPAQLPKPVLVVRLLVLATNAPRRLPAGVALAVAPAGLPVQGQEEYGLNRQIIFGVIIQNPANVHQANLTRLFRLFMNGVTAAEVFMNMIAEWWAVIKAGLAMLLWQNVARTQVVTVSPSQTDT